MGVGEDDRDRAVDALGTERNDKGGQLAFGNQQPVDETDHNAEKQHIKDHDVALFAYVQSGDDTNRRGDRTDGQVNRPCIKDKSDAARHRQQRSQLRGHVLNGIKREETRVDEVKHHDDQDRTQNVNVLNKESFE